MTSFRTCAVCGRICEQRGANRCDVHLLGWKARPTVPLSPGWDAIRNRYIAEHPRCQRCGAKAVTVDHIKARAFGGTDDLANLRSLCPSCAKAKDVADSKEGMRRKHGRASKRMPHVGPGMG